MTAGKFIAPLRLSRGEAMEPIRRWTPTRKARIVEAIFWEIVTADEMMAAHAISADELEEWMARHRGAHAEGMRALTRAIKDARA